MNIKKTALTLSLSAALLLGLAACGDDTATASTAGAIAPKAAQVAAAVPSANMGPVETAMEAARLMKTNDIKGMLAISMPAAELKKIAQKWDEGRKEPVTDTQRKEFADGLSKVLAPGAIDEMMAVAEPQLVQLKAQMPMYVGMGAGMMQQSIQSNPDMTAEQKKVAEQMVTALQTWAGKTDFSDPQRLRKAATELVNGVRATNITTLDQMKALSFDQLLGKSGVMFAATKKALNAYDFNVDEMFSSQKAEQVSMNGDSAVVRTSATLFGSPIVSESTMVKIDGRWYSKDMIEGMKKMAESETESTPKAES
jgi:hypothetical protein